jgi:hypothetical protein
MAQLFADLRRPLLDQAVPRHLEPLPLDEVGEYVAKRFTNSGREAGPHSRRYLSSRAGTRSAA